MQISPEKVKYFRQENGWSQELLAKASGLSLRTIQRIEKDGNASAESQLALAAALDKTNKELALISPQIEVQWKWRSIMQSIFALITVLGAVIMLVMLGGDLGMFADGFSAVFLCLFMYAATAIAFGGHGLIKSIVGLKFLFVSDISPSDATYYLSDIFKKQIYFLYGGALVGLVTGYTSILSHYQEAVAEGSLHAAYAVCLLVLLYAAIIAEGMLRPLSTKLAKRQLS